MHSSSTQGKCYDRDTHQCSESKPKQSMGTSLNLERSRKLLRNQQLKASQLKPGTTIASQLVPSSLVSPSSTAPYTIWPSLPSSNTDVMRPIPQHKIPNGTQMPTGKSEAKPHIIPSNLFNFLSRCSPISKCSAALKAGLPYRGGQNSKLAPKSPAPCCTPPPLECGQDP